MINFAKHINENWNVTATKKQKLLDNFCLATSYTGKKLNSEGEEVDISKVSHFNREIIKYIISRNEQGKRIAINNANITVYEEIETE